MIKSNGHSNSNKLVVLKDSRYINPFYVTSLFLKPMETSESKRDFLMFSGVIERDQWQEMG